MSKGDGGLAFPRPASIMGNGGYAWDQEGLTKREWFAGMALPGIQAEMLVQCGVMGGNMGNIAKWAYEQADAMLREGAKQDERV